jgi:beta-glucosidase
VGTSADAFLWGVATAGHQVEGNNVNADWWEWEHTPGSPARVPSGDACDSYHRFEDDIRLISELGLNAYRFSLEWSRIEPEQGEFSRAEIAHYRRMLVGCRERGIAPVVSFSHITLPRWVNSRGGHAWDGLPEAFARFAQRVGAEYAEHLGYVITLNEPDLIANLGYRFGTFPGSRVAGSGDDAAARVTETLVAAHHRTRDVIRGAAPGSRVGISIAAVEWGEIAGFEEQALAFRRAWEGPFYEVLDGDDFLGVNAYTRLFIGPEHETDAAPALDVPMLRMYPEGTRFTDYGYEFRPEAAAACVRRAIKLTGLPVIVTENGVPAMNDSERVEYLERSIETLIRTARSERQDLRGYFHWSLLDNFEWTSGFDIRFGLMEVDSVTFERRPKPSAAAYSAAVRRFGSYPLAAEETA